MLYEIFNKILKKKIKEEVVLNSKFEFFLEWVFDKLNKEKIIRENDYEKLKDWLSKFDLEPINLNYGGLTGLFNFN
ncbi:MAG: hypothetical protein ABH811_00525 [archaeon]